MRERPILFSAPMVFALLAGTKTETRRAVKPQPLCPVGPNLDGLWSETIPPVTRYFGCPYGQPGDRLRVKEHAWMFCEKQPNGVTKTGRPKFRYVPLREAPVWYCADHPERPVLGVVHPETGNAWGWRKKLGRFLPSWASRITLELTAVRVERLNDISEEGAKAEGVMFDGTCWRGGSNAAYRNAYGAYADLWESINGAGSWTKNPWVWALTFMRVEVRS